MQEFRKGKRGRPPTTGEYVGLAEANNKKAANDEMERRIQLKIEKPEHTPWLRF